MSIIVGITLIDVESGKEVDKASKKIKSKVGAAERWKTVNESIQKRVPSSYTDYQIKILDDKQNAIANENDLDRVFKGVSGKNLSLTAQLVKPRAAAENDGEDDTNVTTKNEENETMTRKAIIYHKTLTNNSISKTVIGIEYGTVEENDTKSQSNEENEENEDDEDWDMYYENLLDTLRLKNIVETSNDHVKIYQIEREKMKENNNEESIENLVNFENIIDCGDNLETCYDSDDTTKGTECYLYVQSQDSGELKSANAEMTQEELVLHKLAEIALKICVLWDNNKHSRNNVSKRNFIDDYASKLKSFIDILDQRKDDYLSVLGMLLKEESANRYMEFYSLLFNIIGLEMFEREETEDGDESDNESVTEAQTQMTTNNNNHVNESSELIDKKFHRSVEHFCRFIDIL